MFKHIAVRKRPGSVIEGIFDTGEIQFRCVLGKNGTNVLKRESDGSTPAHRILRPVSAYWRADRLKARPSSQLPIKAIGAADGWCDEPASPVYNMPIRLPFVGSHEEMKREDCLYDVCIVLDWNMPPNRSRGRGSAIFLHVAKPGFPPTAGCIALARCDVLHILARLTSDTRITVLRQS
ncbi:MAG: L,D-transpeptidase family protein [Pseudomonadota bacterium]